MSEFREGQTATNPKTGQKIVFREGAWRNVGAGAAPPRKQTAAEVKSQLGLQEKARGAAALEQQLNVVEGLYNKNFKGVGPGSLLEYLPTPARRQFDAAVTGLRPLLKPLIRNPGEGTFTDADQALLDKQVPGGSLQDAENEQRIANLRRMIESAKGPAGAPQKVSATITRLR